MSEPIWLKRRALPLIVAHRGSSALAPENTLASFRRALHDGCDAIELDARLTRDGMVVVFHDARLGRTAPGNGRIEDRTFLELRRLSAGKWFHPEFEEERIPTLEEVYGLIEGRIGINVELKQPRRGGARHDLVDRCMKIARAHRAESLSLFSSFDHRLVRRLKKDHPDVVAGILVRPFSLRKRSAIGLAHSIHAEYLVVGSTTLRKRLVNEAHHHELLLGEYTVNTRMRARRSLRFGVDAVFTDDPARLRKIIQGD